MSLFSKRLFFAFAVGLALNVCIAEQNYDERFARLFSTNCPAWLTNSPHQANRVTVGMSMDEVIARTGEPHLMCRSVPESAFFFYSTNGVLHFKNGKLQAVGTHGKSGVTQFWVEQPTKPDAERLRYTELFASLIDTNNPNPRLPESEISFTALRNGELLGVKLGMTMAEAVAAWGKPNCITTFTESADLVFAQAGARLKFRNGSLQQIAWLTPNLRALKFDNGLAGTVNLVDLKTLVPDFEEKHKGIFEVETNGSILTLDFDVFQESGNLVSQFQGFLEHLRVRTKPVAETQ